MAAPLTKRAARWNGWLTALLLGVIAVAGNRLAGRFLGLRKDFSQDQLYAISDATRSILGRLDDQLSLRAYVTDQVDQGNLALLQARVRSQLAELSGLAPEHIEVSEVDPSVDSTAFEAARSFGMRPYQYGQQSGTRISASVAYMGLVMRYRSRQEVLPRMDPWTLEAEFAGAVRRLISDRRRVVGWLNGAPLADPQLRFLFGSFEAAKARLGLRYEVQPIEAARLEAGSPIPPDVEVLVVVRPHDLLPRAVFALDQFVQRGGRILLCVDQSWIGLGGPAMHTSRGQEPKPTGLEALLQAWGAPVVPVHVWDVERPGPVVRAVSAPDRPGQSQLVPLEDPSCPVLRPGLGDTTFPPTASMGSLQLYWAQPIAPGQVPEGVKRLDVLTSSERTWPSEGLLNAAVMGGPELESLSISFAHRASAARSMALACVLEGRFPTPFTRGAPAPFDATQQERGEPAGTTDEDVLSAAADSALVVFGDADWLRDPAAGEAAPLMPGLSEDHGRLLDDLVDWLLRDDELIAVRAKQPRSRPLRDLDAEALAKVGLVGAQDTADSDGERRARRKAVEGARRDAAIARYKAMLIPPGVVLVLLLLLGLAGSAWSRRAA